MRATLETGAPTPTWCSRRTCFPSRAAFCRRSRCRSREPLDDVLAPWREAYAGEPFIEITADTPSLRDVVHRNVVRISAAPLGGHAHADAARDVGDRQPGEGRRRPGGPEREPDARSRRDRGAARVTRVVKIGGRPQADPALGGALSRRAGAQTRRRSGARARRRRRGQHAAGGARRQPHVRRRAPRHDRARTSSSCAWRSRGARTSGSSRTLVAERHRRGRPVRRGRGADRRRADGRRAPRARRRPDDRSTSRSSSTCCRAATCR